MLYIIYNNNAPNRLSGVLTFMKSVIIMFGEMGVQYVEVPNLISAYEEINNNDSIFLCTSIAGDCRKNENIFANMKLKNVKIFVYNTEDIYNSVKWKRYLKNFLNSTPYCVMDFSKQRLNIITNPNKFQITPGYHKYLENIKKELIMSSCHRKKIDVLIYGSINERRTTIERLLKKNGVKVKIKKRYINHNMQLKDTLSSKIVLDTYFHGITGIDFFRCSFLASNKIFFIHETPSIEDCDEEFLNTVVHCTYENIPSTCVEWLSKTQEERDAKAVEVYNLFKKKYNLEVQFKNNSLIRSLCE
jgi:hypothetical protein